MSPSSPPPPLSHHPSQEIEPRAKLGRELSQSKNLPFSQLLPLYRTGHAHVVLVMTGMQVPLFWHRPSHRSNEIYWNALIN